MPDQAASMLTIRKPPASKLSVVARTCAKRILDCPVWTARHGHGAFFMCSESTRRWIGTEYSYPVAGAVMHAREPGSVPRVSHSRWGRAVLAGTTARPCDGTLPAADRFRRRQHLRPKRSRRSSPPTPTGCAPDPDVSRNLTCRSPWYLLYLPDLTDRVASATDGMHCALRPTASHQNRLAPACCLC